MTTLFSNELPGENRILPIWHNVDEQQVSKYIPLLAERLAVKTENGAEFTAKEIVRSIQYRETLKNNFQHPAPVRAYTVKNLFPLYANIAGINFIAILLALFYPVLSKQSMHYQSSFLNKEMIIITYLVITTLFAIQRIKVSWSKFIDNRNINYRTDIIAILIFGFFFVILNSGLFVSLNTSIPVYPALLNKPDFAQTIKQSFMMNCVIATIPAVLYTLVQFFYIKRAKNDSYKTPLWGPTFILSMIPTSLGFFLILLFAEKNFASYVFVALFPFVLTLLAIQGYSHPLNVLNSWSAKSLYIVSIASCFFGFLVAVAGMIWFISYDHQAPITISSLLSKQSVSIDWSLIPYDQIDYRDHLIQGAVWKILTDIFFLELFPGFLTVLTIFHYQLTAGRGRVTPLL